jgi:DNA-binding MarR family transcriptional regulator
MAGKIEQELKQTKPARLLEEETTLNILRTAEVVTQQVSDVLRPYDLSPTQYNVLRILRGAGSAGVTCKDISERMITRDPDVTRLLDRLARRGLIRRDRADTDRRYVTVRMTAAGLALVNDLDRHVDQLHRRIMKRLQPDRLRTLVDLLEQVRGGD